GPNVELCPPSLIHVDLYIVEGTDPRANLWVGIRDPDSHVRTRTQADAVVVIGDDTGSMPRIPVRLEIDRLVGSGTDGIREIKGGIRGVASFIAMPIVGSTRIGMSLNCGFIGSHPNHHSNLASAGASLGAVNGQPKGDSGDRHGGER